MRSLSSCVLGDMECDRTSLEGNGVWTGLQSLIPYFSRRSSEWSGPFQLKHQVGKVMTFEVLEEKLLE